MKPIEDEQNLITVPCPKCGVMMGWIEGHPVDKNCNICNDRHAQAVKVAEKLYHNNWFNDSVYDSEFDRVLAVIERVLGGKDV